MPLFDDRERTYEGPAAHGESTFLWMNRSAAEDVARVRETLESWFERYPEEDRADLRARLRSTDDVQHEAAAFELLLHEVLRGLGCDVAVHPETPTAAAGRPDFLAEPPEGQSFYLEATLVTGKSDEVRGAEQRKANVYDLLEDLESQDVFLAMKERGVPATSPPTGRMRSFLEERMRELDPDEVAAVLEKEGRDALPRWNFELRGWELEFHPIPKSPAARGPGDPTLGIRGPAEVRRLDPAGPIRGGVLDKAGGYGELRRPFVVAVADVRPFGRWRGVQEALFGEVATVVPMLDSGEPGEARAERIGNGVWYRGDRAGATGVSAVLACLRLRPWSVPGAPVRVYHNPWADRPLQAGLEALPSVRVIDDGRLEVEEGEGLGGPAGLAGDWPHD